MEHEIKIFVDDHSFTPDFGEVYEISNGGYEEGYETGYTKGYAQGETDGYSKGESIGYEVGYAEGHEAGNTVVDGLIAKTLTEYRNTRPIAIGNRFFSYFYNLVSIDIPNAVSVGDYAFVYCTALKKIVLPSASEISAFAFQNCSALGTVDLHVANALRSNVFTNTNLSKLILRKTDAITRNESTAVFNNTPISRGEGFIYVPDHLVDQYNSATNWSTYASQIKPISELN